MIDLNTLFPATADVWIGGNDIASEGRWVWDESGDLITFNGLPFAVSSDSAAKDCLVGHGVTVGGKVWMHSSCTTSRRFLC